MKLIPVKEHQAPAFLEGLNPEQTEAVITTNGPVLIIAGAGSGKTRVLTYRIAYLLSKGINPYSILALTFTNKAAGEMKNRIASMVGESIARKVWAGTFHSVFARILRIEAESLGFTNSFSIYDTDDSLSVIRSIMNTLGISIQQFTPQSIRSRISNAKNHMIGWQQYEADAQEIYEKQTALVYKEYDKRLKINNAMDFDDILLNMIKVLQLNPEIKAIYQKRFSFIMVDEYQDTNRAQYLAVQLLAGGHKNICVVGDDAQSIYRWRGADIRNILEFKKDYPDAVTVRLEQNYRSTKTILAAADNVISHNKKQLLKALWTDNPEGDLITVISNRDDRDESESIMRIIKEEVDINFTSEKDFAILYRTNAQSLTLEDSLRKAGIAYTIIGGTSFYKRKEVKDTLAYLRLLCNPKDSESLARVINEPPRGIGPTSVKRLQAYAQSMSIDLFAAFEQANIAPDIPKKAMKSALDFTDMVKEFRSKMNDLPADELATLFIEATGLLQSLKDDNSEESLDRWSNIQRLLSHITEMKEKDEAMTLEDYLQYIALISDIDETVFGNNRISLMTMHAAKGLEFPIVFIAGMEKGLFPLGKAEFDQDEEEEERRLFYVGITRAEKKLYLSFAEKRYRFGELVFSEPSKFINEINPDLLEWKAGGLKIPAQQYASASLKNTNQFKPAHSTFTKNTSPKPFFDDLASSSSDSYSQIEPDAPIMIKSGMNVKHNQFGIGKVQMVSGEGEKKQAVVVFDSVGKKQLLLKYAKLEIV